MAKFQFAFEKVLNHRKTLEDLAQRDFQLALSVLNDELLVLEKMQQAKHDAFTNRHKKQVQGGIQAPALTQVHDFISGQDIRIERQRKKIQEIEKGVEALREVLRLKAVDTKIIEGLRERKQEEFRTEQKKLEQKRLDDQTSTRFRR